MTPTPPSTALPTGPIALPKMDAQVLNRSFAVCSEITRTRAGNFYHGLRLLREPKRSAMYALYAWMRAVDDLADEPDTSINAVSEKQNRLSLFRTQTEQACRGTLDLSKLDDRHADVWPAVQQTFVTYQIPMSILLDMIAGQLLDQTKTRYRSFAELESYCYQVASTVGLACLCIWGYRDGANTREKAIHRGIALQLTNILRDLVEDAQRDRLYLPTEELQQHGIDPTRFLTELHYHRLCVPESSFAAFMHMQIQRVQSFYASSRGLENQLEPHSCAACWAMGEIYHQLLQQIAADPTAVLRGRVSLTKWRKLGIVLRAKFGHPWIC